MTHRWPISAHVRWLFTELPFEERVNAAAQAGFGAVEDPEAWRIPADDWRTRLADAGLSLAQIGIHGGDTARGEKGIAGLPDRRDEFLATLDEGLDFAASVGAPLVHVMAGIVPPESRTPAHFACLAENLSIAQDRASRRGLRIIIEPMSTEAVPNFLIATLADALTVIRDAGTEGLGVLLDIFHFTAEGLDPAESARDLGPLLAHVHLSDYPGRHEPGTGQVDFACFRQALEDIGYAGVLGSEYAPKNNALDGICWMDDLFAGETAPQ